MSAAGAASATHAAPSGGANGARVAQARNGAATTPPKGATTAAPAAQEPPPTATQARKAVGSGACPESNRVSLPQQVWQGRDHPRPEMCENGAATAAPTAPESRPTAPQAGAEPTATPSTAEAPATAAGAASAAQVQAADAERARGAEAERRRAFLHRLEGMKMGDTVQLLHKGEAKEKREKAGTLYKNNSGYLLLAKDGMTPPAAFELEDAASKLAPKYELPVCMKEEFSSVEAQALSCLLYTSDAADE